jgi:predicted negative regulator of RcsB-dependent stress response
MGTGRSFRTQDIGSPSCNYALQKYDDVGKGLPRVLSAFPKNEQEAEVEALLGDALAAQNKPEEAIPAYVRSYKGVEHHRGAQLLAL